MTHDPSLPPSEGPTAERVWDLPTRLLHVLLGALFLGAFGVAVSSSEHSPAFVLHAALGLMLVPVLFLRLLWGLLGSRPSRFSAFPLSPRRLMAYLLEAFRGKDRPFPAHNPGAAWAAVGMLLLLAGLVVSGVAMGVGWRWGKALHEGMAFALLGLVVLHLLGIAWHSLRHGENLAMSMVHGRRRAVGNSPSVPARPWAALAFLALASAWGWGIYGGTDLQARRIRVPGMGRALAIQELEETEGERAGHGEEKDDD